MNKQRTIGTTIKSRGIALHSGKQVTLTCYPASINQGIVFKRTDLSGREIAAKISNVVDTNLCTTLGVDNETVSTVEHLLSAAAMLGIDNLIVSIDNQEIPIMDGSSAPFIFLLESAGIVEQDSLKKVIKIKSNVSITDGEKSISVEPSDKFSIKYKIDFNNNFMDEQGGELDYEFSGATAIREISRSRTFGFKKDLDVLLSMGLAKGGSLKNAILVDDNGIENPDGLRIENEFVRHKILDAIGDFYLSGFQILGRFKANKSGHELNTRLIRKILDDPNNYELITCSQDVSISYTNASPSKSVVI